MQEEARFNLFVAYSFTHNFQDIPNDTRYMTHSFPLIFSLPIGYYNY